MKYCKFKEVDYIKEMCQNNPYIYGVIDPSCALCSNSADKTEYNFNFSDLYYVKQPSTPKPKTDKANMRYFANALYFSDIDTLQPILKKNGLPCVLEKENFNYLFPFQQNGQTLYLRPLENAFDGGVLINIRKLREELSDPSATLKNKKMIAKYYNTLLEYSYVSWIYTFICQKLQEYITNLEGNDDLQHTRTYDTLFGYIYQNYIEPAILQLQRYFISFKIDEAVVEKDIHLFDIQKNTAFTSTLKDMTFYDFTYSIYCLRTNTAHIDEESHYKTNVKQTTLDKINSLLHLLVAYNEKIQNLLGAKYAFEQKPFVSYEDLIEEYKEYQTVFDNDLDSDPMYS